MEVVAAVVALVDLSGGNAQEAGFAKSTSLAGSGHLDRTQHPIAPSLRPLLTPPNGGTQKDNRLDFRVALKKRGRSERVRSNSV
jgi:hypothetical protein